MINIVIPMAGSGSRFVDAGYTVPKPFIDVNGKMMIERVLDSLRMDGATYTLIIQEEFKNSFNEKLSLLEDKYGVNLATVNKITQGASCTALSAFEIFNNDNTVAFADSDNFFKNNIFKSFVKDAHDRKLDGSLLTFYSKDSCYSFVETDSTGYAIRTREKEVISNNAIAGVYLFSKGSDFVKNTIKMLIYGDKTKNEYYMSNVYNWAIEDNLKIGIYNIKNTDWACVGTPEKLNIYLSDKNLQNNL